MLTSFYTMSELKDLGLAFVGNDVKLSRKASLYNPGKISIGEASRIDDFCVLAAGEGGIEIGRNVHVAVNVSLIGQAKITVQDFAGISSRTALYSSNDDYSGEYMTNPTVDSSFTHVTSAPVFIGRHAIVGTGCVILPGVNIGEGASIGAMSFVHKDCQPFMIYVGVPARAIRARSRNLLLLEKEFLAGLEGKSTK